MPEIVCNVTSCKDNEDKMCVSIESIELEEDANGDAVCMDRDN